MNKKFLSLLVITCTVILGFAVGQVSAVEVGDQAPDFTLTDAINGSTISLADYRGKVVLLDFFFTTCGPCINAIDQELVPLYNQYYVDNPNVEFLSIDIWETGITAQELQTFANNHGIKWPVLMGADSDIDQDYGIEGAPTIIILDTGGVIKHLHLGYGPELDIKGEIDALLLEEPPPTVPEFPLMWLIIAVVGAVVVVGCVIGIVLLAKKRE